VPDFSTVHPDQTLPALTSLAKALHTMSPDPLTPDEAYNAALKTVQFIADTIRKAPHLQIPWVIKHHILS